MKKNCLIIFDDISIKALDKKNEIWSLLWSDIEQIGYKTTSGGPANDYFLVFKKRANPAIYYDIPMDCPGAIELAKFIDSLPNTKLPREGKLANCIENKSVTIWPTEKSGEAI